MDVFALLIPIALVIAFIASFWVIYTKAGEAGWKCLIPIYNLIVLLKIINKVRLNKGEIKITLNTMPDGIYEKCSSSNI